MASLCSIVSILFVLVLASKASGASVEDALVRCLQRSAVTNFTTIQSSPSSNYYSLLNFSLQNLRYTEPSVRKPFVLIVPQNAKQVQKSVVCCIQQGWEIRVRSGGHSYEGLSSTSDVPFVIIDLMDFNGIKVDMLSKTAWVDAGATVGELYSAIADKTADYGFPAGVCPTMGTGGHFSGGGLGLLSRKYGTAADNVIDALIIDSNGNLLNRKSMGEDHFWALRGGGGGSWGVVISWRIRLVKVPPVVTVFNVDRTGRNQVTDLVHRWQSIAPSVEEDLFIRVVVSATQLQGGQKDIRVTFNGMYVGPLDQLLRSVNKSFPEMGMTPQDCNETSWLDSTAATASTSRTELRNRYNSNKNYFKAKSDFVRIPIPKSALEGAWQYLEQKQTAYVIFAPLGGRMDQISSSAIPFPHRAGNLYGIQYQVTWTDASKDSDYIAWMRKFYEYMAPFVANSPRAAYANYLDLDLGTATNGTSTVDQGRAWGEKYFLGNFDRLVKVKSRVDSRNVFRNSQSIPVMMK
eukprot:Gb_21183 [translate_table: standard]